MRILIAEDDSALASFVKKGLDAEHYAVDVSNDGEQARAMAGEFDYDLVVLDLTLPSLDGVTILRYLRTRKPSMPIIVLTGRTRVEDRVQCLDLGADDYLGKPFSFSELSARIRALLRRCHMPAESVLTVEDLKLDRVERRVERAGRRIDLTGKEFALLEYLMRNAGRRITRAMIIEHVWNLSFDTCTNVVDVYVNYSTAQVDKKKVGQLSAAIQVAFQELGAHPTTAVSSTVPIEQSVAVIKADPVLPLPDNEENPDLADLRKELEQALGPEISRGEAAVRFGREGLVISLREAGFFDSGSAGVKAGSEPAFSRMATLLGENQYNIRIEGHTDNVRIHNTQFTSNWELSTARSTEMIRLLIVKYGIAPQRLSAGGYGEFHPTASNSTEAGRALNRRVDVVVVGKHAPEPAVSDSPLAGTQQ
ncbi:MAG TPA: response regulator [Terriglobales bacterium]|nr:response regulator [Terriglobales bacterium]